VPERDPLGPDWRTSSRSDHSDCVEVALMDDHVFVRDSKNRSGPVLTMSKNQWRDFLQFVTTDVSAD
jgi:hypothetical protein